MDPAQLAALAAVHRRGSFEAAAAELHVTPSAVSQRIKALEEATGALLIRRGTPCQATETGLRLVRHHEEVTLLEATLARDLPGLSRPNATLRIAVNADSLATWVIPALAAVDGFLFDLVIDDQDVSQDWLRKGEVMAAITSHPGPLQGCDTCALGALRYRATASPAFMARWFPDGFTLAHLAKAPALTFSEQDRLQTRWAVARGLSRPVLPTHRIASSQAFVDACLAGLAWGMNPDQLIRGHLAQGSLVEIVSQSHLDLPLYWQFTRLAAPALQPLTAAIRQAAGISLVQEDQSPASGR